MAHNLYGSPVSLCRLSWLIVLSMTCRHSLHLVMHVLFTRLQEYPNMVPTLGFSTGLNHFRGLQ